MAVDEDASASLLEVQLERKAGDAKGSIPRHGDYAAAPSFFAL